MRNVKTSLTLRNSKDAAMVPMEQMAGGLKRHESARRQPQRTRESHSVTAVLYRHSTFLTS